MYLASPFKTTVVDQVRVIPPLHKPRLPTCVSLEHEALALELHPRHTYALRGALAGKLYRTAMCSLGSRWERISRRTEGHTVLSLQDGHLSVHLYVGLSCLAASFGLCDSGLELTSVQGMADPGFSSLAGVAGLPGHLVLGRTPWRPVSSSRCRCSKMRCIRPAGKETC